jgi:hypothetical protein
MKKELDKFDKFFIFPTSIIPIILFTPAFELLYKTLMKGQLYGIFSEIEPWLMGGMISFLFFLTLFLFILEIKKRYLIFAIILALLLLSWYFEDLDYIYIFWYFVGPLSAFILAIIFLFIKNNRLKKK